jgi:hypothetical protein
VRPLMLVNAYTKVSQKSAENVSFGYASCCNTVEMRNEPKKNEQPEVKVDPRLVEVVRIIVEDFGGDVRAFLASIRPKMDPHSMDGNPDSPVFELAGKGR